jgi:hypothetical protein
VKIKVSQCRYGHSPDKRGRQVSKYANLPVTVKWSSWHGKYVVLDGNDRLYYAIEDGKKWIEADIL